MTQDEIIELAQTLSHGWWLDDEKLEAFAKLVAAKEREACAKVCEYYAGTFNAHRIGECADAIRARGEV